MVGISSIGRNQVVVLGVGVQSTSLTPHFYFVLDDARLDAPPRSIALVPQCPCFRGGVRLRPCRARWLHSFSSASLIANQTCNACVCLGRVCIPSKRSATSDAPMTDSGAAVLTRFFVFRATATQAMATASQHLWLHPRPRDLTKDQFKWRTSRSAPHSSRRRETRTITEGAPGTSMPGFLDFSTMLQSRSLVTPIHQDLAPGRRFDSANWTPPPPHRRTQP